MLKKHVNANHFIIAKMFEEEVNRSSKEIVEKTAYPKKVKSIMVVQLLIFFAPKYPFQNHQKKLGFLQPINL